MSRNIDVEITDTIWARYRLDQEHEDGPSALKLTIDVQSEYPGGEMDAVRSLTFEQLKTLQRVVNAAMAEWVGREP